MKVLFVTFEYPPKTIGGIGTYAEYLVRGLTDRGIDVHVITRGDRTVQLNRVYRVLTPNTLYWRRFFFTRKAISLIHELSSVSEFDLVHLNGTYPVTCGFKLPTVSTFHALPNVKQLLMGLKILKSHRSLDDITYLLLKNPVGSLFDVLTSRVSDRIICPSPVLARDLVSCCFVNEEKIHVIPNGVDLKSFDESECADDSFLDKYAIQRDSFLLYIGRLSLLKGVQHLIEAFKIVQERHPDLKLVIAGKGEYESDLRRIACDTKGIVFVGYIDSIAIKKLLYEASLAVTIPSLLYEVLPMSLLEGMVHGKPLIATNVLGNSSMVKHGENGFLSKPRDTKDLAKCINMVYEDPTRRRKMGMLSRRLVEESFDLERMVDKVLKVYDSLI